MNDYMTEEQQRQHDREYRAWLICRGILTPRKLLAGNFQLVVPPLGHAAFRRAPVDRFAR